MLLKSKRLVFGFAGAGLILLGVLGFSSITLSNQLAQFSQIKDGMDICFGRVTDTFRAQASGGAKELTSGPYTQMTEECFAELKDMLSLGKGKFFSANSSLINSILTDVYWLHRQGGDDMKTEELNKRFDKIEQFRINLEDGLSARVQGIKSSLSYLKMALGVVLLAAIGCFAFDSIQRRKNRLLNERFELAAVELRQREKIESNIQQASLLLQEALQFNELAECSKLCGEVIYKQQQEILWNSDHKEIVVELEPDLEIELELEAEPFNTEWHHEFSPEQSPEHLCSRESAKIIAPIENSIIPSLNVEERLDKLLNHFQSQFNQAKLFVDIRGQVGLKAKMSEEGFDQTIFAILNSALLRGAHRLVIALDHNNDYIELNFFDDGSEIYADEMNLAISRELISEFSGKLHWENSPDFGRHIACHFIADKTADRRTVSITKTTKRQWKEHLQAVQC